ncbi:hypothetical protein, partial [Xanthomonas arboricola]|uniref:hypothetical protein n=1 Tax=Xanthomonas arboricola TaxID=56448 RepID=UPI001EE6B8A7
MNSNNAHASDFFPEYPRDSIFTLNPFNCCLAMRGLVPDTLIFFRNLGSVNCIDAPFARIANIFRKNKFLSFRWQVLLHLYA